MSRPMNGSCGRIAIGDNTIRAVIATPPPPAPRLPARFILVAENLARAGFHHGFSIVASGFRGDFGPNEPPHEVAAHVRVLAAAIGFEPQSLRQVHQVHGARVVDGATLASPDARTE